MDPELPAAFGEGSADDARDGLFDELASELSPLDSLLRDLAGDIAAAWR